MKNNILNYFFCLPIIVSEFHFEYLKGAIKSTLVENRNCLQLHYLKSLLLFGTECFLNTLLFFKSYYILLIALILCGELLQPNLDFILLI